MSRAEFSVYQWFPDGQYEKVLAYVEAERAVATARALCTSVGARIGTTTKVMITDGADCSVFEWEFGKGIVFPENLQGAAGWTAK